MTCPDVHSQVSAEHVLFYKENIRHIKTFGKNIPIVNTLDSDMVGPFNFFCYCLCKNAQNVSLMDIYFF